MTEEKLIEPQGKSPCPKCEGRGAYRGMAAHYLCERCKGSGYLRPQPPASEVSAGMNHPVFAYLLGEGPLEGRWFGDEPPKTPNGWPTPYWWRKYLRAAIEAYNAARGK